MAFVFTPFKKIPRLSRDMVVTEKLDGTNASVHIMEDGEFITCSRNRIITPGDDNYGFSKWAHGHKEELMKLCENDTDLFDREKDEFRPISWEYIERKYEVSKLSNGSFVIISSWQQ